MVPRCVEGRASVAVLAGGLTVAADDQAAVAARIVAVPAGAEPPVVLHEEVAAVRLAGHVGTGDQGAVLRFVHELEHELGPWAVNPWRLIEHMADLAIRRRSGGPAPAAQVRD
jgi:hypothetical protein